MRKGAYPEGVISDTVRNGATPGLTHMELVSDAWNEVTNPVPREMEFTIYIEGEELVTILCTPTKLTPLVLGFLYSEGIIGGKGDIASMRVCEDDALVDVRLSKPGYKPPARRTIASGCGGGARLEDHAARVPVAWRGRCGW